MLAKWRMWQSFPGVPLKKLDSVLFLIKTFLQFLLPPAISCVRSPKVGLPWVLSKSQILESEVEPEPCLGLALVLEHVFLSSS